VGSGRSSAGAATFLAAILAAAGLATVWSRGRVSPGSDFYQFWMVAQVIGRADVPSIYDEEAHRRLGAEFVRRSFTDEDSEWRRRAAQEWHVLEPTATPLLYSVVLPLTGLGYERAHLVFRVVSLVALAAGVVAIALLLGHTLTTALVLLAMVSFVFRPLTTSIHVGQVNEIQLAAIALYLWLSAARDGSRRQAAAGALLAGLVLFKPNLLATFPLLAAGWAVRGRGRKLVLQAVGAAAGGLLALGVTTAVFGSPLAWWDWLEFMRAFPPEKIPLRLGNVSLANFFYETRDWRTAPLLGTLSLGVMLACVWKGRPRGGEALADDRARARVEDATLMAAGCLVYLLSAPLVWNHYLLLALPVVLLLLRDSGAAEPGYGLRRWLVAVALVAISFVPVMSLWPVYPGEMYVQAELSIVGILLLFGLTAIELARPRP
jgi:hypothetical protein